jgi:hypothetical protein
MNDGVRTQESGPVGYKNPPAAYRFQKGKSGNPTGAKQMRGTTMAALIREEVVARNGKGERRRMTHEEHINLQLALKAARGDTRAAAAVYRLRDRECAIRRKRILDGDRIEPPPKPFSKIWREFAKGMYREARRALVAQGKSNITDREIDQSVREAIRERLKSMMADRREEWARWHAVCFVTMLWLTTCKSQDNAAAAQSRRRHLGTGNERER